LIGFYHFNIPSEGYALPSGLEAYGLEAGQEANWGEAPNLDYRYLG